MDLQEVNGITYKKSQSKSGSFLCDDIQNFSSVFFMLTVLLIYDRGSTFWFTRVRDINFKYLSEKLCDSLLKNCIDANTPILGKYTEKVK